MLFRMNFKDTLFSVKQTINCGGVIMDFASPRVMGILNITPDSFFDGGRYLAKEEIGLRVSQMLSEGADIIDVGACSSRPGAVEVTFEEEKERLNPVLGLIRTSFHNVILSVDTFRSAIADYVVKEFGVTLINDISSGLLDSEMMPVVGSLKVPYIMMHMQGTPQTMQLKPSYQDVTKDLLTFFAKRITAAREAGIIDIIVDPGFGFGKTMNDNYTLLKDLRLFEMLGLPVMAGLSRKSMIYDTLQITPDEALNGTTVLHTLALNNGAKLLRVHDVKEAVEAIRLFGIYHNAGK
jgi:dihydropteroate synthase